MPDQQFTHDDLQTLLAEELGLDVENLAGELDTSLGSLGLDSLSVVEIQLAVRRRHGVALPDEVAQTVTTVRDALQYINDRLGWAEAA